MNIMMKTYSELISISDFKDRYLYLQTKGSIGDETFGYERYLNQRFYSSREWKENIRPKIIARDNGCNMAHADYPIYGRIIIHHINPITSKDIKLISEFGFDSPVFNFENLICVSHDIHNAIHFGSLKDLPEPPIKRFKNDTCPWKG